MLCSFHFFQSHSKLLGLVLAFTLFCVALVLSSKYLKAIYFNLSENAIHFQRSVSAWIGKMSEKQLKVAENRLIAMMKLGDEQAQFLPARGC